MIVVSFDMIELEFLSSNIYLLLTRNAHEGLDYKSVHTSDASKAEPFGCAQINSAALPKLSQISNST